MIELNIGKEIVDQYAQKYGRPRQRTTQVRVKFLGVKPGKNYVDACKRQFGFIRVGPRMALRLEINPVRLTNGFMVDSRGMPSQLSIVTGNRILASCGCGWSAKLTPGEKRAANHSYRCRLWHDIHEASLREGLGREMSEFKAAEALEYERFHGESNINCRSCGAMILETRKLKTVLWPTVGDPLPRVWALYNIGTAPTAWEPDSEDEARKQKSAADKGLSMLPYAMAYEASRAGFGGIRDVVVEAPEAGVCGEVERHLLELEPEASRQWLGFQFRVFYPRRDRN